MIGGIRPVKRCLTLTFRLSQESDVFWCSLPRSVLPARYVQPAQGT